MKESENLIFQIVYRFYERATSDIIIGHHFRHIPDFNTHLPRISAFWEIQLYGKTNRNLSEGFNLINIHKPLQIKKAQVRRWIIIFKEVLEEFDQKLEKKIKVQWIEKLNNFEKMFLESNLF